MPVISDLQAFLFSGEGGKWTSLPRYLSMSYNFNFYYSWNYSYPSERVQLVDF